MFPASVESAAVNVPPEMRPGVTLLPKIDSTLHGTGLQPVQISAAACLIAASVADGFANTPLSDFNHVFWSGAYAGSPSEMVGFSWIFGLVSMYWTSAAAACGCFVCELTIHSPPPIDPVTWAPFV